MIFVAYMGDVLQAQHLPWAFLLITSFIDKGNWFGSKFLGAELADVWLEAGCR